MAEWVDRFIGADRTAMARLEDHCTPAQLALRRLMEQISEDRWAAGWYGDLERIVWADLSEHRVVDVGGDLTEEEWRVLTWLVEQAGGWWTWPREAGAPVFVPLEEWRRLCAQSPAP